MKIIKVQQTARFPSHFNGVSKSIVLILYGQVLVKNLAACQLFLIGFLNRLGCVIMARLGLFWAHMSRQVNPGIYSRQRAIIVKLPLC